MAPSLDDATLAAAACLGKDVTHDANRRAPPSGQREREDELEGLLTVRLAEAVDANEDGPKLAALPRAFVAQFDRVGRMVPKLTGVN